MKKFITRMKEERTPHERRQFALKTAGIITAVLFVGWAATLSVRLAGESTRIAETAQKANTASALEAVTAASAANPQQQGSSGWFGGWFGF